MSIIAGFLLPHPACAIPQVGKGDEDLIFKTVSSMKKVANRIAELKPDTIVMISAHAEAYSDYFQISDGDVAIGSLAKYDAYDITFRNYYDREFVKNLCNHCQVEGISAGIDAENHHYLDHGTMIPLYFINQKYRAYNLVRMGVSGLPLIDHYKLGEAIKNVSNKLNRRVVVVASGDLSHCLNGDAPYGFNPIGEKYDARFNKLLTNGNFIDLFSFNEELLEDSKQCCHRVMTVMAGTFDKTSVSPTLLSYEGQLGTGFSVAQFETKESDNSRAFGEIYLDKELVSVAKKIEKEDKYVSLARSAIETFVKTGKKLKLPPNLPPEMLEGEKGVFITIREKNSLRGCLGSAKCMSKNVATEIVTNAMKAATEDPRFNPISEDDLPYLNICVSVVTGLMEVKSVTDLDPKFYGLVVELGSKHATLLPGLSTVHTAAEQLALAKRKAGIMQDDKCRLYRFAVENH